MLLRQFFLVGLISALTVTLTGRSSVGFTLIPPQPSATSNWRPVSPYLVDDNLGNLFEGRTEVDTRLWTQPIPLEGTGTFSTTLWIFKSAQNDIDSNFKVASSTDDINRPSVEQYG